MGKRVNRPKKGMLKHFSEGFPNEDGRGVHFWGGGGEMEKQFPLPYSWGVGVVSSTPDSFFPPQTWSASGYEGSSGRNFHRLKAACSPTKWGSSGGPKFSSLLLSWYMASFQPMICIARKLRNHYSLQGVEGWARLSLVSSRLTFTSMSWPGMNANSSWPPSLWLRCG